MSRRRVVHPFSRRQLVFGASAVGAYAALTGCGGAESRALGRDLAWLNDPASARFPLGASSGDVSSDRAVLWTQYLGDAALKLDVTRPVLNRDTDAEMELPVLTREVTPSEAGFVHETLTGLHPGETYRYRFVEDVGTGRTAEHAAGVMRAAIAANSKERMVFTASSCSKNGKSFDTIARAAARPADLHVLLGDTVYADAARSMDEYRGKWTENLSTAAYRRLRETRSVLATWDDHEVSNDWSGDSVAAQKVEWGEAAFFEHTPIARNLEDPNRVWRSVRWGLTAEFFILDGRSERRVETRGSADAEYLSKAQFEWFTAAIKASPARFKVIVNSVPIGAFPSVFAAWTKDQWVGYQAQREALLSFLDEERIEGAFFLSGDFHMSSLGRVDAVGQGPGERVTEVLVGAAATNAPNPFAQMIRGAQFDFISTLENVGVFGLDPVTGVVDVEWIGKDGLALAKQSFVP